MGSHARHSLHFTPGHGVQPLSRSKALSTGRFPELPSGRWVIGSSINSSRVGDALMGAGWLSQGPSPRERLLEGGGETGNSRLGWVSVPPQDGEDPREAAWGPRGAELQPGPFGPLEELIPTSQPVPIARSCHGDPLPPSATAFPVKPLQKSILPDRHAPGPHPHSAGLGAAGS